MMYIC